MRRWWWALGMPPKWIGMPLTLVAAIEMMPVFGRTSYLWIDCRFCLLAFRSVASI